MSLKVASIEKACPPRSAHRRRIVYRVWRKIGKSISIWRKLLPRTRFGSFRRAFGLVGVGVGDQQPSQSQFDTGGNCFSNIQHQTTPAPAASSGAPGDPFVRQFPITSFGWRTFSRLTDAGLIYFRFLQSCTVGLYLFLHRFFFNWWVFPLRSLGGETIDLCAASHHDGAPAKVK